MFLPQKAECVPGCVPGVFRRAVQHVGARAGVGPAASGRREPLRDDPGTLRSVVVPQRFVRSAARVLPGPRPQLVFGSTREARIMLWSEGIWPTKLPFASMFTTVSHSGTLIVGETKM